jgi:hypothetical protein
MSQHGFFSCHKQVDYFSQAKQNTLPSELEIAEKHQEVANSNFHMSDPFGQFKAHAKVTLSYLSQAERGVKSEWISVEERLPRVDETVLGFTSNNKIRIVWIDKGSKEFDNMDLMEDIDERYTHWMPLPNPPKK